MCVSWVVQESGGKVQRNVDSLRQAYLQSDAYAWVESSTSKIEMAALEPFNCQMVKLLVSILVGNLRTSDRALLHLQFALLARIRH